MPGIARGPTADPFFQPATEIGIRRSSFRGRDILRTRRGQINGSGDGNDAIEQSGGCVAEFTGEFQRHVAAKAIADQVDRDCRVHDGCVRITLECIRGEPGVVHGLAERFGSTATSHVLAMYGVSVLQRELGHAANVAGITGSFQSMHHDDLAACIARGTLLMDQHLSFGIGLVQTFRSRESVLCPTSPGEVRQDGENVRILEDRLEREQILFTKEMGRCHCTGIGPKLVGVSGHDRFRLAAEVFGEDDGLRQILHWPAEAAAFVTQAEVSFLFR